jgi:hypothetical protein
VGAMQRIQTQEFDRIDEAQCLPGPRSERVGPGSHTTPIAPAVEPTDPLASAGPMLSPSDWPSTDELESALLAADPFEFVGGSSLTGEITELFSEIEPVLPRDTLPSPPPSPEEPLRFELPRRR